ncbi:MAG: hypothetical protein K6E79_00970, partial [Pseudobutyrivibrio sp.]|nr:hypothetical protein [Pseudobutyrivibrio sp.]
MLLEFFNLTSYYWPRLLAGLWFSVFNIYVFNKYGKKNEHILRDGIILFLISSGFLSIIGEDVFEKLYYSVGNLLSIRDESNFFFIATSMVGDSITVFLGGMFFTYYTNKKNFLGAAIYLQYVCLERLCSIVAINQLTYILLYILFMGFLYAIQKKDLPFLFSSTTVSWRRIYLYLIGLFYVLDLLYGAYYIFPELPYSGRFSHYALWLNAVALLNSAFVAGYIKANYSIAREHDKKIKYMKKLQNSQED